MSDFWCAIFVDFLRIILWGHRFRFSPSMRIVLSYDPIQLSNISGNLLNVLIGYIPLT